MTDIGVVKDWVDGMAEANQISHRGILDHLVKITTVVTDSKTKLTIIKASVESLPVFIQN